MICGLKADILVEAVSVELFNPEDLSFVLH